MKILIVSALYPPYDVGGAEKSVSLIAQGLVRRGHAVTVATVHEGHAENRFVHDGVQVVQIPLRNIYWPSAARNQRSAGMRLLFHAIDTANVAMARAVGRLARTLRPDIALTNNLVLFSALAWSPLHDAGIPILHTLRDFYLLCPKSLMFRNGKPCARQCADCKVLAWPRRRLSRHVDGITGVSQYMIDRHRALGLFPNARPVRAIVSAIDLPAAAPGEADIFRPGLPVRFGYIGRVAPEKGLDYLLDALREADPSRWTLRIAGRVTEGYLEHLRRRSAGLPVEFLGFMNAEEFYREVDIVAVPSAWEEPLPRTLLEAFAHGLPVIGSTRGGIPEVLKSGENGYAVDLDSPDDFRQAVLRVLDRPEEARGFGQRGRDRVVARTNETVAADYEAAIAETLAQRRGAL